MDLLHTLLDFVLHLDRHLVELLAQYGVWIYALLFAVVFAETGLVVVPVLPGDSLLFALGALCGLFAARRHRLGQCVFVGRLSVRQPARRAR